MVKDYRDCLAEELLEAASLARRIGGLCGLYDFVARLESGEHSFSSGETTMLRAAAYIIGYGQGPSMADLFGLDSRNLDAIITALEDLR